MNFLCDVHIAIQLSKQLESLGHHSEHVNFILNRWNTKDSAIADYADRNNLILITKDLDFRDSHLLKNSPKKLIRITLGNFPNKDMIEFFTSRLPFIEEANEKDSFYIEMGLDTFIVIP